MLIHLVIAASSLAHESAESEFQKTCPLSRCGSIPVRFPLRLQSDNPSCSLDGLDLTCSPDNRTLHLPAFPQYKITNISYLYQLLTVDIGAISLSNFESSPCPLQNLSSLVYSAIVNLTTVRSYYYKQAKRAKFVRCSKKISTVSNSVAGPITSCYEKDKYFVYVADYYGTMDVLGHDCEIFGDEAMIPELDDSVFSDEVYEFMAQKEVKLKLSWYGFGVGECSECERKGKYCGFDWRRIQTFCLDDHVNL